MLSILNSASSTPDSIQTGINRIVNLALQYLRAQDIPEKEWDGDRVAIKSQFPSWVQDKYDSDPESAPVIDFFIYYYRWLLDYDDGYGCGFYLENLRDITKIKPDLLQAYADEAFSKSFDLTDYPELIDNFRTFFILYARDYVSIRGTPQGIEYFIKAMFKASTVQVTTTSSTSILIVTDITNTTYQNLIKSLACPFSFTVTFDTP